MRHWPYQKCKIQLGENTSLKAVLPDISPIFEISNTIDMISVQQKVKLMNIQISLNTHKW